MARFVSFGAVVCAASLMVGSVQAQTARVSAGEKSGDVSYAFDDDALAALGNTSFAQIAVVRGRAHQVGLIRPRAQFVTEMLKSVEAL